jgi:hypothetical protein
MKWLIIFLFPLFLFAQEQILYVSGTGAASMTITPSPDDIGKRERYWPIRGDDYTILVYNYKEKVFEINTSQSYGPIWNSSDFFQFSQTIIDDDDGWEFIHDTYKVIDGLGTDMFEVVDDNGDIILDSKGTVRYSTDGENTYLISTPYGTGVLAVWRFRSLNPPVVLQKKSSNPGELIINKSSGIFGVQRIQDGKTITDFFDGLGRLLYSRLL